MKKVPSIFKRDWKGDKSRVTSEINPECLWVFRGEGIPTRKFDGTAVRILNGELWVRFDAKNGKTPPLGFEPAEEAPDPNTGHWTGWVFAGDHPQYKWQREAFRFSLLSSGNLKDGTYEACGPHFQGNPEKLSDDVLVWHGVEKLKDLPYIGIVELTEYFKTRDIEGIVWHHPDGRMAKIKAKDLGIVRKP